MNVNYYRPPEKAGAHDECRIRFSYVRSVHEAGGIPVLAPCIDDETALQRLVSGMDGFVFIGGKDYPPRLYGQVSWPETEELEGRRVAADLLLARLVRERGLPVLGICGGHQLLNIERGGGLIQNIARAGYHKKDRNERCRMHWTKVTGGKILRSLFGTRSFRTNSSHHQALDPSNLGQGLTITALATDGTVEAVEAVGARFVLGVQWHPEAMPNNLRQRSIFKALIGAAAD